MKKTLTLAVLAFVAALGLTQTAVARPTNAWNFKTLLLQADQTENNQGRVTNVGPETHGAPGTQPLLAGSGTASSTFTFYGLFATSSTALGQATQNLGVNVSTVIPVNSSFEYIVSSGMALVLTSLPNVATTTVVGGTIPIADGTFLVLTSTSANGITLQSNGNLTGSGLFLGAATRVISAHKRILLQYSAFWQAWEEIAYINDSN